ncbi:MAG: isoleucine--tRNA ligase [bacterium]
MSSVNGGNDKAHDEGSSGVNFIQIEHDVLAFWKEHNCFDKLREKLAGGPTFRFLDGPITANNPMGVHHAWGRTLKDVFVRYKTLRGYDTHWQNGFDSQGLWVEVEVEKEIGFKDKSEIEKFGIEKFVNACKARVKNYSTKQTEQSIRLGQWMDWPNSYYTHTDENIQGIWHFLRTLHDKGWIYTDKRAMSWCTRCGTSLSEHEMSGSHREMTHRSLIVALPIVERPGQRVLVWTTTPWTLAANVALAINPAIEYAEISVAGQEGTLIIGKDALKAIDHVKFKVLRVFKGEELFGLHYETVFPDLPAQAAMGAHKIVSWDEVDAEEGTGVVHIAPGCGAEDFELGNSLGLPSLEPIDEAGVYVNGYGWLEGRDASQVADDVIAEIRKLGKLFYDHDYTHSYPVCWRCKTPIMFKLVNAWFIRTDELKPQLLKAAAEVDWRPAHAGLLMQDWLQNMGDWNISRKRFYGMPLPFYVCHECGEVTVVGSRDHLRELGGPAVDNLPELHRPWIDSITITCPHCHAEGVTRIPEVGDVWLDAGIVPYTTRGYFRDREEWEKKWYPAEWICEMREQVRLWFYSMLFMGVTISGRSPYQRVLAHESVVSEEGGRFSKTGYMIQFDEAADKIGADAMRYLFCAANPVQNVRFGFNLGWEVHRKLLGFWNIFVFFNTYAQLDKLDLTGTTIVEEALTRSDRWALARTEAFLDRCTAAYDDYNTTVVVREFETFVDELSNFYVRVNRRRFWKESDGDSKRTAYVVLSLAIRTILRVMAPIIPFLTEHIWQEAVRPFDKSAVESVHLADWPVADESRVDDELLGEIFTNRAVIRAALNLRNQAQLKVRQPLQTLYVVCESDLQEIIKQDVATIADELNVKTIEFADHRNALDEEALMLDLVSAGKVLRGDAPRVKAALDKADAETMQQYVETVRKSGELKLSGVDIPVPAELFKFVSHPRDTIVAGEVENQPIVVALDIRLSDELLREGLVRDLIRKVQVLRKDTGFDVEDRIELAVMTDAADLLKALDEHNGTVRDETLSVKMKINEKLKGAQGSETTRVGAAEATLQVKKV